MYMLVIDWPVTSEIRLLRRATRPLIGFCSTDRANDLNVGPCQDPGGGNAYLTANVLHTLSSTA
jgi:hypothetical protein